MIFVVRLGLLSLQSKHNYFEIKLGMMRKQILVAIFSLIVFWGYTQQQSQFGTYQVQVVNSRLMPNIPGDIDQIASEKRKKSERVYIQLDPNIRIMILSEDEIKSETFKPLPLVAHLSSAQQ